MNQLYTNMLLLSLKVQTTFISEIDHAIYMEGTVVTFPRNTTGIGFHLTKDLAFTFKIVQDTLLWLLRLILLKVFSIVDENSKE